MKLNRVGPLIALSTALLLSACGDSTAPTDAAAPALLPAGSDSGLRVNGEAVSQELLEAYARMRGWNLTDPSQLAQVREKTAELVAIAQAARERGMLDDEAVQADLALERLNTIAGRLMEKEAGQSPDEAVLRAEYEREKAELGTHEYRVAHLLVDEQSKAAELAAQALSEGFEAARIAADGQPGVRDARELGWVKRTQLPAALRPVVDALEPGSVAGEPVQSEFGWHVVSLLERRDFSPAPFEQVRAGIASAMQRKQALELSKQIIEQARIEGL